MREPVCYILTTDGNNYIAFDVVTSVQWTLQGRLSSTMVQSGTMISDHYDPDSPTLTMTGIVSETKLPSKQDYLRPAALREEVVKLMESRTPFKLFGTEDETIPDMDDCVILNFAITKDTNNEGGIGVSLTVKKINFTNALVPTDYVPVDTALASIAEEKEKGKGSKTDKSDEDQVRMTAAFAAETKIYEAELKGEEIDITHVRGFFGGTVEQVRALANGG